MLWAGAASSLSYTMADVNFTVGGASGTIQLVAGSENVGPPGPSLSGTPGLTDDLLVFRVVMSSGSVVEVGVGIFLNLSSGSGTVAGPNVNVLNGAITSTGASLRTFSFDSDGNATADSLSGTGTSDSFWVTWANVADGATVSFMVNNGTTQQTFLGTVFLPEPTALALLAVGLGALAIRRVLRG
jgi:hypothetical protein